MAVSEFHLSLEEFYDMTPRCLIAMIKEWREIQISKAVIVAHIGNGGKADDLRPPKPDVEVNSFNVL